MVCALLLMNRCPDRYYQIKCLCRHPTELAAAAAATAAEAVVAAAAAAAAAAALGKLINFKLPCYILMSAAAGCC